MYKKTISIVLIVLILLNFVLIPNKSYAVDPITLTLGALYTYEVAQALYLTILTATAVGVTFATIDEWKNYQDMVEGTSPGPIEQYPEWETARQETQQSKSDLATNHWFDQWELKLLPGGGGDPDPENNKKGILALMGATGIMGGFINNFISMFQKLELEEGENSITNNDNTLYYGITDEIIISLNNPVPQKIIYYRKFDGLVRRYVLDIKLGRDFGSFQSYYVYQHDNTEIGNQFRLTSSSYPYVITVNDLGKARLGEYSYQTIKNEIISENDIIIGGNDMGLKLNVNENSSILEYGPYNKIPQPNLIPIPRHKPTTTPLLNPDGKPKPGIQSILNPDGSIEERYYGDADDLLEDIIMNTPINKILNPDTNPPYVIEPGPDHIKITYPDRLPTEPYPQPEPYPYPTPNMPPGILPGQYPGPGPYPPGLPEQQPGQEPGIEPGQYPGPGPYPFPEPEPYPNPSPQTPVEPGKQLDYTPWFQIIINWLVRIYNKIPILPDIEPGEEPGEEPVEEPGEEPGIDFSPLQDINLTNKFPFSIPWDIKASIELLVDEPEAPRWEVPMVSEKIVIDLDEFESLALISRSFLSLIFIVMLMLLTKRMIGGS